MNFLFGYWDRSLYCLCNNGFPQVCPDTQKRPSAVRFQVLTFENWPEIARSVWGVSVAGCAYFVTYRQAYYY